MSTVAHSEPHTTVKGFAMIGLLAQILLLLSTIALAFTGLGGELVNDEVRGYGLLLHMSAGGVFTVCLPIVVLSFAARLVRETSCFVALAAWILIAAALTSLGTIVLSMTPWFGTDGLKTLLKVHELSGIVLVIAAVLYGLFSLTSRRSSATAS